MKKSKFLFCLSLGLLKCVRERSCVGSSEHGEERINFLFFMSSFLLSEGEFVSENLFLNQFYQFILYSATICLRSSPINCMFISSTISAFAVE
jgi:hypothetical protein